MEDDHLPKRRGQMSILFVCYGNACRSPMAEGLAKLVLGNGIRIESAGLIPILSGATQEAVQVLQEHYGIDISQHQARSITDIPISSFDRIVVLDAYVFGALKNHYSALAERLILWDVEDPYGQDMRAFRKTAEILKTLIENHLVPLYSG